jgi:hypothetical protein
VHLQRIKKNIDRDCEKIRLASEVLRTIFTLRTIIEQSLEWNSPLYFMDFEKAFDNIHHPTNWKILEAYGMHPGLGILYIQRLPQPLDDAEQNWYNSV